MLQSPHAAHANRRNLASRLTHPLLRTAALAACATFALASVMLIASAPGDQNTANAQAVTLIDYDIDDDGLIDITNATQFYHLHSDRDGNGDPSTSPNPPGQQDTLNVDLVGYRAAFPNAMPGMGCQLTDADNNPATDDVPTCRGYELLNDIDTQETGAPAFRTIGQRGTNTPYFFRTTFKGNGYRILNPTQESATGVHLSVFGNVSGTGTIEGLGVINPSFTGTNFAAGIASRNSGTIVGSYVWATDPSRGPRAATNSGGLVAQFRVGGWIDNSYIVGNVGLTGGGYAGGIIAQNNQWNAQTTTTCRNSYFSGNVRALEVANPPPNGVGNTGLIHARIDTSMRGVRIQNCLGDITTDAQGSSNDAVTIYPFGDNPNPTVFSNTQRFYGATYRELTSTDAYIDPFDGWETDRNGDPQDVWDFGGSDDLPVLKGYGHDRAMPRTRDLQVGQNPADMVNICSRTRAVAHEILQHLLDENYATGITSVPDEVAALEPCSGSSGPQMVSLDNLRDLVVTSEDNPFRLDPDRTDPPSNRLTALHADDLAYLVNASHFDFSDNSLTSIPPRIFQGLKVRQLDVSGNSITSLHADTFAGTVDITEDETTRNILDFSNNRIATLPDRIFDDVSYMNGISLAQNSITEVNTRWFEKLGNLGYTDSADREFRPALGLQLSGNTITEHYYWQRAYDEYRPNLVEYTGTTAAAVLRNAIRTAMEDAGTDTTNLDLQSVSHLANNNVGSGQCPSGLTQGPAGSIDLNGNPVQCISAARWSPPWQEGVAISVRSLSADSDAQSVTVSLSHSAGLGISAYQVRYRRLTSELPDEWTETWRTVPLELGTAGTRSFKVPNLALGTVYQFQVRAIAYGIPGPTHEFTQGTDARIPEVNKIVPSVREISVQAGQQILLSVEIYDVQDGVNNDLADGNNAKVAFQWSESDSGGGTFASPSTARRVNYTTPNLPGTYTVLAEAQPTGICASHQTTTGIISDEDRAPCIATFTIRVSRAPVDAVPQPDPVNPAGLIPSSLTDSAGVAYAVFTPVDGGTFTGDGITVTAPKGAVPDQQLLGIAAAASIIPVPPPIPGARMTVAGNYYEVNGVQRTGDAPVTAYTLDEPLLACMPLPDIFRADLTNIVVVNRNPADGTLAILTSSIRQTASGLTACGAVSRLPATVAVANIGVIQATPEPEAPTEDLPETGGKAPSASLTLFIIAVSIGLVATAFVGTHRYASARRRYRAPNNTPAT